MSNRTNRTLSATINGLNLGTRSHALQACVDNGTIDTLRLRLAHASHPGALARFGTIGMVPATIIRPAFDPAMPGLDRGMMVAPASKPSSCSSSRSSWPSPSWRWDTRESVTQGQVVAGSDFVFTPRVVFDVRVKQSVLKSVQPTPQAPPRPTAPARACWRLDPASRSARAAT